MSARHEDMIKTANLIRPSVELRKMSYDDQALALSLLDHAKKLRKVCPECGGKGEVTLPEPRSSTGQITFACCVCEDGYLPIEPEDVEVRVKG